MSHYRTTREGTVWTFALYDDEGHRLLLGAWYSSRPEALEMIEAVRARCSNAGAYERRCTTQGYHYFTLRGATLYSLAAGNFYAKAELRDAAIEACMMQGPTAEVCDEATVRVVTPLRAAGEECPPEETPLPVVTPRYVITDAGAGWRIELRDDLGRPVMSSLPVPYRAAAVSRVESIWKAAGDELNYTRHISDSGRHSFRLHGENGAVLATSGLYDTQTARDRALERCKVMGPVARLSPGPARVAGK